MAIAAVWNGEVIARSNDLVMCEGNAYFPLDSILDKSVLVPVSNTTHW
jgi:uncharacterized protein (DUF427 family)